MGKELELAIKISGKLDKSLNSAVRNAQTQLNTLGKNGGRALTALTAATVAAGVKVAKDSIEAYQSYESALNSAAAVAGFEKGTKEYEMMNAAAREAGRTTIKTAEDSAHALEYMALAGWSVEDSTKALMPVLKLSAATNTDLATTSDLVTDSMANLGLGINDLQRYLDVSAAANNKSNQTAMQLQEAYLGVGGVLKNLNAPIEESAAVLGVLANRGTKGSEAGTALNAILVNMQKQSGDAYKAMKKLGVSMYDARGDARSILDVFQEISEKTAGMTEEQRNLTYQMIGGKAHVDSMAKIMAGFTDTAADGKKEIYSLKEAFDNAGGSLDKLYGIKTDTFAGTMETLKSAYESMLIDIGERIAPSLRTASQSLIDNMPNIENAIVGVLDRVIPLVANGLNFAAANGDKIIKVVTGIVKAFLMFKALKGVVNIAKLAKDIKTLTTAAGGLPILKGAATSLSGLGTGATAALGSVSTLVAPLAAVGAGLAILYAYNYRKEHWAEGMKEQAAAVQTAAEKLTKYNELAQTVAEQREIIKNPYSSTEDVEAARAKLQEIAALLEKEYNLTINADTTQLENAINMAQSLNRAEYIKSGAQYLKNATDKASDYAATKSNMPQLQSRQEEAIRRQAALTGYYAQAQLLQTRKDNGKITAEKYNKEMERIGWSADQFGYSTVFGKSATDASVTTTEFLNNLNYLANNSKFAVDRATTEIKTAQGQIDDFENSARDAGNAFAQALASDTKMGNRADINDDIVQMQTLGQTMIQAGANTDELSMAFAAAALGYTDFSKAVTDGKAAELADNFLQFKIQIGDTSENAVQGAALIKNGFENVETAAAAGDAAVNAIIADMARLGEAQGMFSGLDNNGIAAKLSEMAQAMNLIPDNKQVVVNATGNFEVIERAQQAADNFNGAQANAKLGVDDKATEPINKAQGAMDKLNGIIAKPIISANDQASGVINSVSGKLDSLNGKTATTTIITEYKTKGTPPGNSAAGTDYWRGGLTYVNDQRGVSDPRELITYGGRAWWYNGRDVLADVPRGARILTAAESRPYIDGSHRNGLERVPFDGYVAELHEGERVLTADQADGYGVTIDDMLDIVAGMTGGSQQQNDGGGQQIIFSPQITIAGGGDKETVMTAMRMSYSEFREYMQEYERDTRRRVFG